MNVDDPLMPVPEVDIVSKPLFGLVSVSHDVTEPSVLRYLPALLACGGKKLALTAADGERTSVTWRY